MGKAVDTANIEHQQGLGADLLAVVARLNRLATQRIQMPLPAAQARLLATIEMHGEARIGDLAAVEEMKAPMELQRDLLRAAIGPDGVPPKLDQVGALLEVTKRQERLVEELLTLARSQQAVIERVPVELADIAFRVSDELEPEARRAGIELRVAARPARTPGDPVLLERLAENLLQNAVRYNTADGWVRVATGTEGDTVHLTVANTGPVVPVGKVHALFEPFRHRVDRDSAGLGLSIVRSVAHAHGGEVSAAARDGGGLVVEVTLPAH